MIIFPLGQPILSSYWNQYFSRYASKTSAETSHLYFVSFFFAFQKVKKKKKN